MVKINKAVSKYMSLLGKKSVEKRKKDPNFAEKMRAIAKLPRKKIEKKEEKKQSNFLKMVAHNRWAKHYQVLDALEKRRKELENPIKKEEKKSIIFVSE